MLALIHPYREPGRDRPPCRSRGSLDLGLHVSLLVLSGWTALRVASTIVHGRVDGEGAMAALLLVGVLHLARSRLV